MRDRLTPAERRARFLKLLDRRQVPLDLKSVATDTNGLITERGTFASEPGERVPFLLYRSSSATKKAPAVIVLHGTGGSKEGKLGLLKELAGRGFVALSIDGRFHGARILGAAKTTKEYNDAIFAAYQNPKANKHPLYFDTAWDVLRTVDFLQQHPSVDPKRIGLVGFSKGGIETWLAAATDERIAVAVPMISVQSLRWSLENNQWQGRANSVKEAHLAVAKELGKKEIDAEVCRALWNRVLPGILDAFDCPQMLTAIAPRPLLILSGENDPNCPLGGAKLAFAAAETAYQTKKDRLKIDVALGVAHQVTDGQHKLMIDWLIRWLTPEG
jgi:dienelactone hydrolase